MARARISVRVPARVQVLPQPAALQVGVRLPPAVQMVPVQQRVRMGFVAGARGPKGEDGTGEPAIIIGNTAPTGRTQPWLRYEVDGDGHVQRVLLGTP